MNSRWRDRRASGREPKQRRARRSRARRAGEPQLGTCESTTLERIKLCRSVDHIVAQPRLAADKKLARLRKVRAQPLLRLTALAAIRGEWMQPDLATTKRYDSRRRRGGEGSGVGPSEGRSRREERRFEGPSCAATASAWLLHPFHPGVISPLRALSRRAHPPEPTPRRTSALVVVVVSSAARIPRARLAFASVHANLAPPPAQPSSSSPVPAHRAEPGQMRLAPPPPSSPSSSSQHRLVVAELPLSVLALIAALVSLAALPPAHAAALPRVQPLAKGECRPVLSGLVQEIQSAVERASSLPRPTNASFRELKLTCVIPARSRRCVEGRHERGHGAGRRQSGASFPSSSSVARSQPDGFTC